MNDNAKTFKEILNFNRGVKEVKAKGLLPQEKQKLVHEKSLEISKLYKEILDLRTSRSLDPGGVDLAILKIGIQIGMLKNQISIIKSQKP